MDEIYTQSSGWFQSKEKSRAIPLRKKDSHSFDWTSDEGLKVLLGKRGIGDESFFSILTGVPFPVDQPGELDIIANSSLAEEFVEHVENNMRSFGTTLTTEKEFTSAELRGPVLWSETLSVRGASFGMDYVHVCSVQKRTYDSPENRVIVAALSKLVDSIPRQWRKETISSNRKAIATASRAEKLLSQKPLREVSVIPAKKLGHAKKRARNARNSDLYSLALRVLDTPVRAASTQMATIDDLLVLCDDSVKIQSNIVFQLMGKLSLIGVDEPENIVVVDNSYLSCGGITFRGGASGFVSFAGINLMVFLGENENQKDLVPVGQKTVFIRHPDDLTAVIASALKRSSD